MKKIILSESQSKNLAKLLKESETTVQQMPVDKKMNKPYCVNPEKVLVVKKYLDNGFEAKDYEDVGPDGFPRIRKIVVMKASNGEPLKPMYTSQLLDLLIDKFQNMFLDKMEREMFLRQVMKDWLGGRIGVHGTLSVNRLNECVLNEITSEEITAEGENVNLDPTEKQKDAGNYKMGHISIKGMGISIENPVGSFRKGKDSDGHEWQREMKNHYGYFRNTRGNGKDGDAVDVFIGPHPEDFDKVYVIDQKVNGEFDESKVMLGFYSKEEAKNAYLSNYEEGWGGLWKITGVSLRVFKRWLYRARKQRKPFADYVTIKKHKIEEGVIKEEEYNEVVKIARMFDTKAANEVVDILKAKGIDAYAEGNIVMALIEQDRNYPAYVDEVKELARKIAMDYMRTHSDSVSPSSSYSLFEGIDDFEPIDVYGNVTDNPNPNMASKEKPSFDGFKPIKVGGKMNLKNEETGDLVSDEWFDWVGYMVDGVAVVFKKNVGYNLIGENGNILLPEWHEDVMETRDGNAYIIVDGNTRQKIRIDELPR